MKSRNPQKQDDGPVYLTEEGARQLREKLAGLKRALPARIAETARTAAYGDRSDNAEYKEAKGTLRRTHWQILEIEDQLKRVVVITPGTNATGTIRLGSTVVLETEGGKKTFEIVGPQETDPTHGRISYQSPLGAALLNHAQGDVIMLPTGNGKREYKIVEIR